jgi:hypothetical protein
MFNEGQCAAGAPQGDNIPYGHDVTVSYGRGVVPTGCFAIRADGVRAG